MHRTLATCTVMLAGSTTAALAIDPPMTQTALIDIPGTADRLATLLRSRLPSHMAIELLTMPHLTLQRALASNNPYVSSASLFQLANGTLEETLQAVEMYCESDCLEGRMIVVNSWLVCRTEVLLAHWCTQTELSAEKRQEWLNSLPG